MTSLGDKLYDRIRDAVSDIVSEANYREEELLAEIEQLEKRIEELEADDERTS